MAHGYPNGKYRGGETERKKQPERERNRGIDEEHKKQKPGGNKSKKY